MTGLNKGKLIVVHNKKQLMDGIYRSLPKDMRAERPEEVETNILVGWEELLISGKPGFFFGDGRARYRRHCVVKIIDLANMAEIHQTTFYGSEPYARRKRGSSYGSWPTDEVENYIRNLPKK